VADWIVRPSAQGSRSPRLLPLRSASQRITRTTNGDDTPTGWVQPTNRAGHQKDQQQPPQPGGTAIAWAVLNGNMRLLDGRDSNGKKKKKEAAGCSALRKICFRLSKESKSLFIWLKKGLFGSYLINAKGQEPISEN